MERIKNHGKYDKTVLYSSSKHQLFISRMDTTVDNMTPKDMLEKIAELDYSQSQLRDLNAEMRHWMDVADDEVAVLRTENAHLRKQVKVLENMISEAQHTEAEPCKSILADDFVVKTSSEQRIQSLERESTLMKEQNEKLTTEMKTLQRERDEDKISLSKFRDELQTLERGIEEAQFGLQCRDDVIDQKNLQLKHAEETIEEYSSLIKDLRLTNQELRQQLAERQDEASFAVLNEAIGEVGTLSTPLSFAEEIKLLASSGKVEINMFDSLDLRHEETDAEEQLDHQSLTEDFQTQRCASVLQTDVQRVAVFLLLTFIFIILAFVAIGSCTQHFDFLAFLMLQPYCSVHYGPLPPI